MDSMTQIDIGLTEPFWIIRFKKITYKQKFPRKLSHPKIFKIDLQTIFWIDFYTTPTENTSPRLPEPSELTENLKIRLKSIQIFSKKHKKTVSPQKLHPL